MTAETENLILEILKRIQADQSESRQELRDIKLRLASLENAQLGMARSMLDIHADMIGQTHRVDRLETRIERIENRLELRHE